MLGCKNACPAVVGACSLLLGIVNGVLDKSSVNPEVDEEYTK
jgi:hypothetical protein